MQQTMQNTVLCTSRLAASYRDNPDRKKTIIFDEKSVEFDGPKLHSPQALAHSN